MTADGGKQGALARRGRIEWVTRLLAAIVFVAIAVAGLAVEPHRMVPLASLERPPLLEIRYATAYNFTKTQLYPFPGAWLHEKAAAALAQVQADLATRGLGLKVHDAYRPLSVQQKMWDLVRDDRYVSNPAVNRGRHTRGTAVDVTLVDERGNELPMPTGYDDFTEKAHGDYDGADVDAERKKNRALLEDVMTRHGFEAYPYEWWHFDLAGWRDFPVLDVEFGDLAGGEVTR